MSGFKKWSSEEVITACRFCLMCRHVCSVGNATLHEGDTPRGKALLLHSKLAGVDISDEECAAAVYNCALCYRCLENCVGAFDLPETILATRRELAADGFVPVEVQQFRAAVSSCDERDQTITGAMRARVEAAIGPLPHQAGVILLSGRSTAEYVPNAVVGAARVLKQCGVNFTMLEAEDGTGYELIEMGFWEDARRAAERLSQRLASMNDTPPGRLVLVTLDPSDSWALTTLYRKLGVEMPLKVLDFATYVWQFVQSGKATFRACERKVTYHDPCHLGRVQRVFEPPRHLLGAIPGLVAKEPFFSREQGLCCGGHLRWWNPTVSRRIAEQSAAVLKETGADLVVTACPVCCSSFREVTPELEVVHLAEFLGDLLI